MNKSMIQALVTLRATQQRIDVHANNIANVNTTAYKRQTVSFQDVFTRILPQAQQIARPERLTPAGFVEGSGARLGRFSTSFVQGPLELTSRPLDVAIEGNGVLEVMKNATPGAADAQVSWTRDGTLMLGRLQNEADFVLTTPAGHVVRSTTDEPLRVPANHAVTIDETGAVYVRPNADASEPPRLIGRLKVMNVVRADGLMRGPDNDYVLPEGTVANQVLALYDPANPPANPAERTRIRQGYVERANVDLGQEMTDVLMAQRMIQFNAKSLASADTLMGLTNNLRT
jgi:flagellar basal-body rod protein FlgG